MVHISKEKVTGNRCQLLLPRLACQVNSIKELHEPLSALRETAAHVATVQEECKIEIDVDEYADSFKPFLMDAVYAWSKVRLIFLFLDPRGYKSRWQSLSF